jgi:hypothetical protein
MMRGHDAAAKVVLDPSYIAVPVPTDIAQTICVGVPENANEFQVRRMSEASK